MLDGPPIWPALAGRGGRVNQSASVSVAGASNVIATGREA